ncbi:SDR family NAD(P)-dependent oxidoreductase [Streptomyces flaveolus]|uniref:SDR family NAD(P)-dependent oxidoreductase n=1 Tax=Streptomyces flaveolus TaxID=67297 RepID=UPI00370115CF
MPTWLITGCSTGFGRQLAATVLARGEKAVVTARRPEQVKDLVDTAPDRALALANNAGIGYFAAVEESTDDEIRRMFEINVFGLSAMTKAVLPGMRARRSGTIVNFSSIGGLRSFPAVGYYNATKFAVEGLSEALWQEVEPLGIKVLLAEPGPFRTDWAGHSANETVPGHEIADYAATAGAARASFRENTGGEPGDPARAAAAIYTAVTADNPPAFGPSACVHARPCRNVRNRLPHSASS